jgi:hypothetical protein
MAALGRIAPYVERIVGNEYLHENVRVAGVNLRAAYERASSRKAAKAAEDKKLYARIRRAAIAAREAAAALTTGRRKPKRRFPKRVALVAVAGAGVAAAAAPRVRARLLGRSDRGDQTAGPATAEPVSESALE